MNNNYDDSLKAVEKIHKDIQAEYISFNVLTDDDYARSADFLKLIKNKIKAIEDTRKGLVKPFNDGVKKINTLFKKPIDDITIIKTSLEEKMLLYAKDKAAKELEKQEKLRKEEAEKLKALAEKEKEMASLFGDNKLYADAQINLQKASIAETKEIKIETRVPGQCSTTSIRKKWVYEVVEANKVPAEFLSPDDIKIKRAIDAGLRNIDGIKIYEKEILVSR